MATHRRITTRGERRDGRRARACVGCGAPVWPSDPGVVRLVAQADGQLTVDADAAGRRGGVRGGRGARVHGTSRTCLERAARKGLPRSFRRPLYIGEQAVAVPALARLIRAAYRQRMQTLLRGALRRERLAAVHTVAELDLEGVGAVVVTETAACGLPAQVVSSGRAVIADGSSVPRPEGAALIEGGHGAMIYSDEVGRQLRDIALVLSAVGPLEEGGGAAFEKKMSAKAGQAYEGPPRSLDGSRKGRKNPSNWERGA